MLCPLFTFRSVWDEFNGEHNGAAAADGVWVEMNLQAGGGGGGGEEGEEGPRRGGRAAGSGGGLRLHKDEASLKFTARLRLPSDCTSHWNT